MFCNSGTGSWLHIYFDYSGRQQAYCVGGRGSGVLDVTTTSNPNFYFEAFCPGNNNGNFQVLSTSGNFTWDSSPARDCSIGIAA